MMKSSILHISSFVLQIGDQKHNEVIYFKFCHSKSNEKNSVNNLNYRVTSTQQCFAHCFLEQLYYRLHTQLITGTKTHLSVEE